MKHLVIVRGAGDLATGTILRLHRAGLPVIALECAQPTVIRTSVSFAQAVFARTWNVEGVTARLCFDIDMALELLASNVIPILVDPQGDAVSSLHPDVVVDAILAKHNMGTTLEMAPFVVALGPGFTAGVDCDVVVETQRGHNLGRVITSGSAAANTGIPGVIGGYGAQRVMRAPCGGIFEPVAKIGDIVQAGFCVATVAGMPVVSSIGGVVRGMLNGGIEVCPGFKVADVDPRGDSSYVQSVSDKARAVAGGVLEAVDGYLRSSIS